MKDIEQPDDAVKAEQAAGDGATAEEKEKEKEPEKPAATLRETFSFAETTKTKTYIALGLFFAAMSGALMPASVIYFADILGDLSAVQQEGLGPIKDLVFVFMVLGVLGLVAETLMSAFLTTAAADMTANLQKKWFEALVRQDMAYYDLEDVSGTSTIISTNATKYARGLGNKMGEGVKFMITVCVSFGIAFWGSWRITLLSLSVVPLMALSTMVVLKTQQNQTATANQAYAKAGAIVFETVSAIRTVLSLNAVEESIKRFEDATQSAYDGAIKNLTPIGLAAGCNLGSFNILMLGTVGYGSFLVYQGVRDEGCDPSGAITAVPSCEPDGFNVFLALIGVMFAGMTIAQVTGALEAFQAARTSCFPALLAMSRKSRTGDDEADDSDAKVFEERMKRACMDETRMKRLSTYAIDVTSALGQKPERVLGEIEFVDVSFSYPTRDEAKVFDGFNLKIEAGTTVALVGPSGSGKSTTVSLIERFYDPTSGVITLDGVDLCDLNLGWLRKNVGLVSQEPRLFATTVGKNICIAKPDATREEMENAARRANAHDFIMSLQDGYDTHVGDLGAQLSGGQKQRIAIARTLIMDPKIILLDEATSALDSESEAIVQEALDVIMSQDNATVIVIAHRLSTIKNADMIAVVDQGRVVETGTHNSLLAAKGKYFDLVEAQSAKKSKRSSGFFSGDRADAKTDSETDFSSDISRESSEADLTDLAALQGGKSGVVSCKDVHFAYPSRPDSIIFRGLGLEVEERETVAIVGPSGHGKSTIIQLVEEFYHPSKGMVAYNGDDLKELNVPWYRNEIGLVSQEPTLFDATVAENIKFGMSSATQSDIEEAAKKANAHNFIMEFPDGYNTNVGSASSSQVSGGQKQRIAIARALLRKPKVLLLDEATSALDSESEKIVQAALDAIMEDKDLITIVIAHRLSTIRGADKIAYVSHGKVREIGTYEELMAKPNGLYKRLEDMQSLAMTGQDGPKKPALKSKASSRSKVEEDKSGEDEEKKDGEQDGDAKKEEFDKELVKENEKRAKDLAKPEYPLFMIGALGAVLQGLVFPGWGFVFAYMFEVLYAVVLPCEDTADVACAPTPDGCIPFENISLYDGESFSTCQAYYDFVADSMQKTSFKDIYLLLGLTGCAILGSLLMFKSFGTATERINKRVRDQTFKALVRQEVAYYDVRSVAEITSQLSEDAAMIHSFSGEPIRSLVMSVASVGVGLVVSFVFMWEFALIALGILPFMAFGEYMQSTQMFLGEDQGDDSKAAQSSDGAIVVETLLSIKTVAALSMEKPRIDTYNEVIDKKSSRNSMKRNMITGSGMGFGTFFQMWGYGLMFYWGAWLLNRPERRYYGNPNGFRDFNISLFALMMSLSGLAAAVHGITDADKAKAAAVRIFQLIDRESEIDPLSETGKKQN